MPKSTCSIEECARPAYSRGWCEPHYKRWHRHGSPYGKYRMHGLTLAEAFAHHMPGDPPRVGCWLWTSALNEDGYGVLGWGGDELRANRVSYMLFVGPVDNEIVIRHTCDTPACVHPAHLITGTKAQNSRDMTDRDRQARGELFSHSKLTDDAVREIRARYNAGGVTQKELAAEFGVSASVISLVSRRLAWKHV